MYKGVGGGGGKEEDDGGGWEAKGRLRLPVCVQ